MSPEEEVLTLTAQLPANIGAIFLDQWATARGSWEREDVLDRLRAHVKFMQEHHWDGVKWWPNSSSAQSDTATTPPRTGHA